MLRWLDRSRFLSGLLDWFSNVLAKRRGLPIILGILLLLIGFPFALLNAVSPSPVADLFATLLHYTGLLIALIGVLLAIPLGR